MRQKTRWEELGQYVKECARLLYWSYFKPYTLDRWLKEETHLLLRNEFAQNPTLNRYKVQSWWLVTVIPVLIAIISFFLTKRVPDRSELSTLFILITLGWVLGLCVARPTWLTNKVNIVQVIFVLISILYILFFKTLILAKFESRVISILALAIAGILLGSIFGTLAGITIGLSGNSFANTFSSSVVNVNSVFLCIILAIGASTIFSNNLTKIIIVGIILGISSSITTAYGVPKSLLLLVSAVGNLLILTMVNNSLFSINGTITYFLTFANPIVLVSILCGVFRVCFWIPELLLTLFLYLFSLQRYSSTAILRFLPTRFDEIIHLPLPLLNTLIINTYHDNPTAALEEIEYLKTSTNQKYIAMRVTVDIAIRRIELCHNTGDITTLPDELHWMPKYGLGIFGEVSTLVEEIRGFLEIAQDVCSALSASSAYRQRELLVRPLERLEDLQKNLAFTRSTKHAIRFGNIARRWRNILTTAQDVLAEQAFAGEIPIAYVAGNSLDPKRARGRFKGRKEIFEEIEKFSLMPSPPVLLLYGGRRTGKTSTLKYLPERIESRLVPLLVDLQGVAVVSTLAGFAQSFAEKMVEAARRDRNLSFPDPRALDKEPFLALQTWFAAIERTFPHKRFLLCLDEFERMEEIVAATGSRAPLNFIRHVLQHRDRWIVLFSGTHAPDELADYWSDYLINTRTIRIGFLRDEEARDLVENPIPDFPRTGVLTTRNCPILSGWDSATLKRQISLPYFFLRLRFL